MENLEALKRKYRELGKEIERLEKEKSCKRWKANFGDTYFFISSMGEISIGVNTKHFGDNFRYKTRNYFKTKAEAQRHLDNINTYYDLMDLAEELNKGKEIDWTNFNQLKYKIAFDYTTESLICESCLFIKQLNQIYCLDEDFLEIALEKIGKERLEILCKK